MELVIKKKKPFEAIDFLEFAHHQMDILNEWYNSDELDATFDIDDDETCDMFEDLIKDVVVEARLYDLNHDPFYVSRDELRTYFDTIHFYGNGYNCTYEI